MRTCVVGVGRVGRQHARILSELPDAELVGVHDPDVERGGRVARACGTRHFTDLESLLGRVDAAVVSVPSHAHHRVGRAALQAGCHVLIEKPLAPTLDEADDLIGLAEERNLMLGVGHVERFNAAVRSCEPFLEQPRFVESLRLAPFQPRGTDVTVILDLMIHDIDLVLDLVPGKVVALSAVGVPVLSSSVDIANARLTFDTGAVANITASRVSTQRKRELRLFQSNGYLSLDLASGRGEFLRRREGARMKPAGMGADAGGPPALHAPSLALEDIVERVGLEGDGTEPLRLELESYVRAVRGERSSVVPAVEARAALEVALRITREVEEFAHVVAQDSRRA
ncbi:MAG: Gfo/Idh/MocA family oxidoreductase [Gemmatimonadota bacterium]